MYENNEIVHGSLAAFSACICGIAILFSYITPKQRKFPNVVLIWICISDFLYAIFLSMQNIPGPLKDFLNPPSGTPLCYMTTYIIIFLDIQGGIIGVLIAYILYATIVNHVSFDALSLRYRWYLAIIWAVSLLYPFVVFCELLYPAPKDGPCVISRTNSVFMIVPWGLVVFLQVGFTIPVIKYIMMIKSTVKSYSMSVDCSRMHVWLYIRFSGIVFGRMIFKMIMGWYYLNIVFQISGSIVLMELLTFVPILLSVNGLIVIMRNRLIKDQFRLVLVKMQLLPPLPERGHNPSRRESTMTVDLSCKSPV